MSRWQPANPSSVLLTARSVGLLPPSTPSLIHQCMVGCLVHKILKGAHVLTLIICLCSITKAVCCYIKKKGKKVNNIIPVPLCYEKLNCCTNAIRSLVNNFLNALLNWAIKKPLKRFKSELVGKPLYDVFFACEWNLYGLHGICFSSRGIRDCFLMFFLRAGFHFRLKNLLT